MVTSAVNSMVIVTLKFKTWRRSQPAARKHGNGNGNGHIVDAHGDGNFSNKIQTESRGALRVVTHCGLNKGIMNSLFFVHGLLLILHGVVLVNGPSRIDLHFLHAQGTGFVVGLRVASTLFMQMV